MDGSAQTLAASGLASWNPHVGCSADSVMVRDVLGPAYPSQDLNGSRYQKNSTDGGVPSKRALSPPCSITNSNGQSVSTFVQIDGVYLSTYTFDSHDCSTRFKGVNGGGPYPNNETFCDNVGNILQVGTTSGQIHIEFDQDWLAADYCGSDVPSCDNVTVAQQQSNGDISLDVQGFVYWDGDHWELHPFTAWKPSGSPPPPPPPNAPPTVDLRGRRPRATTRRSSPSPPRPRTTTIFPARSRFVGIGRGTGCGTRSGPRRRRPAINTTVQGTRRSSSRQWTRVASRRHNHTSSE